MPHAVENGYKFIKAKPLHPTFAAEVSNVDFSQPVSEDVFVEILDAITQYGVLVFRNAKLDDARHVAFARLFGELDDVKPYMAMGRKNRFAFDELFDVSNLEDDGSVVEIGSKRHHMGMGNSIFHVDSSFNPRRAGFSLLRAHHLPPANTGGETFFADTRTAASELHPSLLEDLQQNNYIGAHSLMHSRKKAAPQDSPWLQEIDPAKLPMGRHSILQQHRPSGRMNLYIANHLHHLEYPPPPSTSTSSSSSPSTTTTTTSPPQPTTTSTYTYAPVPEPKSTKIINELLTHATQSKYVISIPWLSNGDLIVWDNTCVMHRAGEGTFTSQGHVRDMRRCTVHDGGVDAWGWNERTEVRQGLP